MKCGLEVHYTEQKTNLKQFHTTVTNIKVKGKTSLMPWQHGVRITTTAIIEIYEFLKKTYGIEFILTARFNQVYTY